MVDFTRQDLDQIRKLKIEESIIDQQLANFVNGFPYSRLVRPATPGDGIHLFSDEEKASFIKLYDEKPEDIMIEKFVPASGAATRMFKRLFDFLEKYGKDSEYFQEFLRDKSFYSTYHFINNIEKFGFYNDLKSALTEKSLALDKLLVSRDYGTIIDHILSGKGLGYADLPKALIKFHSYGDVSRVSAEEHLVEAAIYAKDAENRARVHFTLSPEHVEKFNKKISEVLERYEEQLQVKFTITWSIQKKSTDTIAVDEKNEPFRKPDGSLLFRPSGHGALLDNLNQIDSDIIFIKNIDNVVPERLLKIVADYKKLLGGCLLYVKQMTHDFLNKADKKLISTQDIESILQFLETFLLFRFSKNFYNRTTQSQITLLYYLLNRPIRICGMVRNEGEPGGGPFWVRDRNGKEWMEIVESSQIDFSDDIQREIVNRSTHFNPVDLVCCIRDHNGRKFNLQHFVDRTAGFISIKSSEGRTLKAQELPGLWNGAMAYWLTAFIEVPIITFNPVKTVNDLLREEHRG